MNTTIGVVGNGFVGNAVAAAFLNTNDVRIFDRDPNRSTHSLDETLQQEIIFVCVPTPMKSADGDDCDLSILESVLKRISELNNKDNIIVIKSTVPIGTTRRLQTVYPSLNIVHSPEFLTARNAKEDFVNASRHIIGIPKIITNSKNFDTVKQTICNRFPQSAFLVMDSNESEFVKYACNCFLATKVSFFNEIKLLADALELNWDGVMNGVLTDERIGHSHTNVPGPDGKRGFGGTCFPKDINAMIHTMKAKGLSPMVMQAAWEQNKNIREVWDWANMSSAVSNLSD
jgi:UDPglucose 6-dehydrogenase